MGVRQHDRGAKQCYTLGALTATGAETVYDTTIPILYSVDGKMYDAEAITEAATPTADPVDSVTFTGLTTQQGCIFVWCLDATATVGVFQGPVESLDDQTIGAFNGPDAPDFPPIHEDWCPFAYQVIKHSTGGSGTWNFGTDNWNATGVTDLIVDVANLPLRPPQETTA
jgi:hypothetical protein